MKKEFSLLSHFFLIVLLVGFGFFGVVVLQDITALSFWAAYSEPFKNWILAFLAFALVRIIVIKLTAIPSIITPNFKNRNYFLKEEIWITVQYLVVALVSIMSSLYVPFFFFPKNISPNLLEMWLSLKETFLYWFVGFLVVSFLRIGIIYIKRK